MIHYVEGDILLSRAQIIAHGIAPHDHFDKGLALELRQRWPSMVKDYRHWAHDRSPESGTLWQWSGVDADGGVRSIVNLLTQGELHDGPASKPGKATLENVSRCLKELARHIDSEGIRSVALPRLATGVGGLDWNEVRPLVEKHLGELKIPVVVYEVFRQGVEAEEPLA